MSTTLYHTEGIILSYNDSREADRVFIIYTKEFGMISVFAKGIRLQKSKLRYHTNLFSCSRISFVQGKDILRLTDAEELERPEFEGDGLLAFGRISELLQRLIRGQEKDEWVWRLVVSAHEFLYRVKSPPELFNLLFGVRLLYRLGYVGRLPEGLASIVETDSWEFTHSEVISELQEILEKGLQESHL